MRELLDTQLAKRSSLPLVNGVTIMSGKADIVKGRIKEAAGVLTNNDELREAGKTDQVVGKVKQAAQKVVDTAKDAAKKTVEMAKDMAEQTVAQAKKAADKIRK